MAVHLCKASNNTIQYTALRMQLLLTCMLPRLLVGCLISGSPSIASLSVKTCNGINVCSSWAPLGHWSLASCARTSDRCVIVTFVFDKVLAQAGMQLTLAKACLANCRRFIAVVMMSQKYTSKGYTLGGTSMANVVPLSKACGTRVRSANMDKMPPSHSHLLKYCINHIVALKLMGCCVVFSEVDVQVRSLHGLQALSLHGSKVHGDHLAISTLTGLTSLNLTDCRWYCLKQFYEPYILRAAHLASAFSAFVGWPALQVLSVSGCNLFAAHTELVVADLHQLQVTWLKPYINSRNLIIHSNACLADIGTYAVDPLCVQVLVSLYLNVNMPQVTSNLSASIHQLLGCCKALQVLHLISCGQLQRHCNIGRR